MIFYLFSIIFLLTAFESNLDSETLEDTLIDSYKYYPDINKSKLDLQNKRKEVIISKTDFLPSVELSMSQGRKITESFPDTSNYGYDALNPTTIDINISQPLGSSRFLSFESAKNNFKAQKFSDRSIVQSVLLRASKAFYTVLKERFLLDVAIKNETTLKKKLVATEQRFEFKSVTKTDVFLAKASLEKAISERIEAENNLEIAISEYLAVVGREPNINWKKRNKKVITSNNPIDWSKFGKTPKLPKSLNESLELAFLNNPDLNKLKFELKNAEITIRSNTLNFFPEFSISGSYGKSMESSRTIEKKDTFELTANLSMPIFNKGHNFFNLEKSKNIALISQKKIETKEINLQHEVKSAWKKIESLKSSIEALESSVESNLVAFEGVEKEAGVGTRTTFDILGAQQALTEAESNLVNAKYQLINSSLDLLKACGLLTFQYLKIKV
tara:strand:+ start:97 stop:1428 length:1332 start_codon:yes stop_codon:yes gene_type:complete